MQSSSKQTIFIAVCAEALMATSASGFLHSVAIKRPRVIVIHVPTVDRAPLIEVEHH
jgi:hypothetical protein